MASLNKIFLMGNLTRDPQLSYLPSQTPVVDFGMAVNRRWTDKDGQQKESVCFVDCRAYGRQAENINKYLSKGKPLFVEGRLDFDQWTGQDGTKRSKHRVTVESFQFIGAPGGAGAAAGGPGLDEASSRGGQEAAEGGSQVEEGGPNSNKKADDIPF
jgi:single-strand DNA-binding protein